MTHRITASLIAGAALTTLTATGALAHAVPDVEVAKTTLNQTTLNQSAPALVGLGGAAAPPLSPQPCRWPPARWTSWARCHAAIPSTNTSTNRSSN